MRKGISLINAIRVSEFLILLLCIMRNRLGDSSSFGGSIPNNFIAEFGERDFHRRRKLRINSLQTELQAFKQFRYLSLTISLHSPKMRCNVPIQRTLLVPSEEHNRLRMQMFYLFHIELY